MSVSVNPVKTVFETFGFEQCFEEIDAYMAEKNLSMYGVSCTVHNADHSVGRFIMLYSHMDDSLAKTLPFLIEKVDSDQTLKAFDKMEGEREGGKGKFAFWTLGNSSCSRKKLEAVIRKVMKC